AIGFARLHWSGEKKLSRLEARLWMDNPSNSRDATLGVSINFYEAVRVKQEATDPAVLSDEDLEKGATRTIYVWSSTRKSFPLTARLVSTIAPSSDPVSLSPPESLTAEELQKLQAENNTGTTREAAALPGPALA